MLLGILLSLELSSLASTVRDVPGVLKRYTKSDGLSPVTGCSGVKCFSRILLFPQHFTKGSVSDCYLGYCCP